MRRDGDSVNSLTSLKLKAVEIGRSFFFVEDRVPFRSTRGNEKLLGT
jgi:hypothetical protein